MEYACGIVEPVFVWVYLIKYELAAFIEVSNIAGRRNIVSGIDIGAVVHAGITINIGIVCEIYPCACTAVKSSKIRVVGGFDKFTNAIIIAGFSINCSKPGGCKCLVAVCKSYFSILDSKSERRVIQKLKISVIIEVNFAFIMELLVVVIKAV